MTYTQAYLQAVEHMGREPDSIDNRGPFFATDHMWQVPDSEHIIHFMHRHFTEWYLTSAGAPREYAEATSFADFRAKALLWEVVV